MSKPPNHVSILTAPEMLGLRIASNFMTAGEADGVSESERENAITAANKIGAAPARTLWVGFSRMEAEMLLVAIENGAEGVLQPSSGIRPDQKRAFAAAANRLIDAFGFNHPRY